MSLWTLMPNSAYIHNLKLHSTNTSFPQKDSFPAVYFLGVKLDVMNLFLSHSSRKIDLQTDLAPGMALFLFEMVLSLVTQYFAVVADSRNHSISTFHSLSPK